MIALTLNKNLLNLSQIRSHFKISNHWDSVFFLSFDTKIWNTLNDPNANKLIDREGRKKLNQQLIKYIYFSCLADNRLLI